ncbi:hypothetical protein [Collinsella ihumii]|uniref:Uncharacterized protein n=1 Tax=Collinsella ihumii TaxID=1720204 RepID=A0AAW7JY79_9ACTN|nr:hypothetical protein [Collinsella ihumii]MDN0069723.1 hypothetical protein [Collinsella ihumii]
MGYSGAVLRGRDGAGAAPALHAGGQRHLGRVTASERCISYAIMGIFDSTVSCTAPIRRVGIALSGVVPARRRFRPNALLCATSLMLFAALDGYGHMIEEVEGDTVAGEGA